MNTSNLEGIVDIGSFPRRVVATNRTSYARAEPGRPSGKPIPHESMPGMSTDYITPRLGGIYILQREEMECPYRWNSGAAETVPVASINRARGVICRLHLEHV